MLVIECATDGHASKLLPPTVTFLIVEHDDGELSAADSLAILNA